MDPCDPAPARQLCSRIARSQRSGRSMAQLLARDTNTTFTPSGMIIYGRSGLKCRTGTGSESSKSNTNLNGKGSTVTSNGPKNNSTNGNASTQSGRGENSPSRNLEANQAISSGKMINEKSIYNSKKGAGEPLKKTNNISLKQSLDELGTFGSYQQRSMYNHKFHYPQPIDHAKLNRLSLRNQEKRVKDTIAKKQREIEEKNDYKNFWKRKEFRSVDSRWATGAPGGCVDGVKGKTNTSPTNSNSQDVKMLMNSNENSTDSYGNSNSNSISQSATNNANFLKKHSGYSIAHQCEKKCYVKNYKTSSNPYSQSGQIKIFETPDEYKFLPPRRAAVPSKEEILARENLGHMERDKSRGKSRSKSPTGYNYGGDFNMGNSSPLNYNSTVKEDNLNIKSVTPNTKNFIMENIKKTLNSNSNKGFGGGLIRGGPGNPNITSSNSEDNNSTLLAKDPQSNIPLYLVKMRKELEQKRRNALEELAKRHNSNSVPDGYKVLTEAERNETLPALLSRKKELEDAFRLLPLAVETEGQKQRQKELQQKLSDLETAIVMFQKPRVVVRVDC